MGSLGTTAFIYITTQSNHSNGWSKNLNGRVRMLLIMTRFAFTPGNFPFQNRNALLDDYTPEEMVGRDDELEEYHAAL